MVLTGTGAMVWWGIWAQITVLAPSAISTREHSPLIDFAGLGGVCIGLVLALIAAFAVAERAAE